MNQPHAPLEVMETPLSFHGGPEEHRRTRRTLYVDDIAQVGAHAARNWDLWYPVCTLTLYGGEEITIALDPSPDHIDAHQRAVELAAVYRLYLPVDADADIDGHPPPGITPDTPLPYDCAVCASFTTSASRPKGTAP
jgi:hypothetical protein